MTTAWSRRATHLCGAVSAVAWLAIAGAARAAECKAPVVPGFDATGAGGWAHVPLSKLKRDMVIKKFAKQARPKPALL